MRTREKLMILLVAITAILGSIIYINFRNNEVEANYFRWLFVNNLKYGTFSPRQFIADELPAGSLLYGGLAVFALVVLIVVLKMLRDGELQALRMRLMDIDTAKNHAESLLQEEVWKGKHERQAKDAATRDLGASIDRIEHLIADLNEKEKLVKVRENELVALKSRAVEQSDVGLFDSARDRSVHAELEETKARLAAKEEQIGELENRLKVKIKLWESQIVEKESLAKAREGELAALRAEAKGLGDRMNEMESARNRAERRLEDELREKKRVLEANDLLSIQEGKRSSDKIGALEHQLDNKDRLLRSREAEIVTIRRQIIELAATKDELESHLRDELGKADSDRRAIEALVQETEEKYAERTRGLQDEIGEKDLLLEARDDEMRAIKIEVRMAHSRLTEVTAAKERAEVALRQELQQEQQRRRDSEVASKHSEDRYADELEALNRRINEREQTVKSRDSEIKLLTTQIATLNEQLHKVQIANDCTAASLQEQVRHEQEIRQVNDSAMRSLEDSFRAKINALEQQLRDKQEATMTSDNVELEGLRTELKSATQHMSEMTAAKEKVESLFREALNENTQLLRSKEIAHKDLEADFGDKLRLLEDRLREKTDLMQSREADLFAAKKQLAELSADKEEAIRSLQATLEQHAELLQSKETSWQAAESGSSETIRTLEAQLNERDEMLTSRDAEVKAMSAQAAKLTAQLAEFGRSKDQDARLLREELKQKNELLHVKDSAIKKIEERFSSQVRALESQVGEKSAALNSRDSEIDTLAGKLRTLTQERTDVALERDKSERRVQEELREKIVLLQAKESSIGEMEEQLTAKVEVLQHQLAEKQKLVDGSSAEVGELRSQVYVLTEKMGEAEGARLRVEAQLHEERNRATSHRAQPGPKQPSSQRNLDDEAHALDDLLKERDELLRARDKLIQELMVELKEKKSQLAKHEISVWQGIERRGAWKHRLSKFGIRLKD